LPADVFVPWPLLAGIAGLLIGSFLNVCIYRIPRDISVVAPRSFCPECGSQIPWFANIPVVSFLLLRGKCRACGKPIGWRYPAVELATALLFAWTAAEYGMTVAALKWSVFEAILIVLCVTDLEERILPDELTIGGSVAGLIFAVFVAVPGFPGELLLPHAGTVRQSLVNAATGACLLSIPIALVGFLYQKVRKRQGLGLGDVKLLVLIGIFLGTEKGISALLIASVGGSVLGVLYIVVRRKHAASYELPFGSFLCLGAAFLPLLSHSLGVL
jgi:leader peptidase (prepilin peptidase)/N-methyltransferase